MITSADEFAELRLSADSKKYLRAANESAPDEVWFEVISRFPLLRKWVAHNKTISIRILDLLSRDPDPEVRLFVAMKNKLSADLFDRLSTDPDYSVRARVALNRKAPVEVLSRLQSDVDPLVAQYARRQLHKYDC
jgi:hypothetical protein